MKDKIINFLKNNYHLLYIVSNIIFLIISCIIVFYNRKYYEYLGYSYIVLSIISFILCLFSYFKYKKIKINDLLIFLIIVFALISAVLAIDVKSAFFGFESRYEGFFTIVYYLELLYLSSFVESKKKKIIIVSILVFGLFHVLFTFLEIIGFFRTNNNVFIKPCGIAINPNFFGTMMVLCSTYSIGLFIDSDDILEKTIYSFLTILYIFGLFASNTLSALIGLVFALLFVFIYSIKNKKIIELIVLVVSLIMIPLFMHDNNKTTILNDFIKTKSEVSEISKGNINDNFGTKRIKIWKESLKVVPKYLLHGVGIDNFYYAFGDKPLIYGRYYYDKAHNEYLQILITQGIFSLLCYLSLYFIIVMDGLINSFKDKKIYLLLPVVGYLVQAFFNISVIEVAPIFFIALGLLIDRDKTHFNKTIKG